MPLPYRPGSVQTVCADRTLSEISKLMIDHQIGAILIRQDEFSPVAGILTDRDIVKEIAAGKDPTTTTAASFLGRRVEMMPEDASRLEIAEKMRKHGVRRVPLLDGEGEIVGLVSLDDLVHEMGAELAELGRVAEIERRNESPQPEPDL